MALLAAAVFLGAMALREPVSCVAYGVYRGHDPVRVVDEAALWKKARRCVMNVSGYHRIGEVEMSLTNITDFCWQPEDHLSSNSKSWIAIAFVGFTVQLVLMFAISKKYNFLECTLKAQPENLVGVDEVLQERIPMRVSAEVGPLSRILSWRHTYRGEYEFDTNPPLGNEIVWTNMKDPTLKLCFLRSTNLWQFRCGDSAEIQAEGKDTLLGHGKVSFPVQIKQYEVIDSRESPLMRGLGCARRSQEGLGCAKRSRTIVLSALKKANQTKEGAAGDSVQTVQILTDFSKTCIILSGWLYLKEVYKTISFNVVDFCCDGICLPHQLHQNYWSVGGAVLMLVLVLLNTLLLKHTKVGLKSVRAYNTADQKDFIEEPDIDGFRKLVRRHQLLQFSEMVYEDKALSEEHDNHVELFLSRPTPINRFTAVLLEAWYRKHAVIFTVLAILSLNAAYNSNWLCVKKIAIDSKEWHDVEWQKTKMLGSCGRPSSVGPLTLYSSWILIVSCIIQLVLFLCPPFSTDTASLAVRLRMLPPSVERMIKLVSLDLLRTEGDEAGIIHSRVWLYPPSEDKDKDKDKEKGEKGKGQGEGEGQVYEERRISCSESRSSTTQLDDAHLQHKVAVRKTLKRSEKLQKVKLIYRPPEDTEDRKGHRVPGRNNMVKGLVRGNEVPSVCIQFKENGRDVEQIVPKSFIAASAVNMEMNLGPKTAHQFLSRIIMRGVLLILLLEVVYFWNMKTVLTDCTEVHVGIDCAGHLPVAEYRKDAGPYLSFFGMGFVCMALYFDWKACGSEGELVKH